LRIYDARTKLPWEGGPNVAVVIVHLGTGHPLQYAFPIRFDGVSVASINSRIQVGGEREEAKALRVNSGLSFQGTNVLGLGFVITPAEREALISRNPRNAERIFQYLGGEEVNTSPTQSFNRHVISFGQMELRDAEQWPDLIHIVRERVKPERDKNNRETRRKYWWRFGEVAPALYATVAPLPRCLVNSQVSKHVVFAFQPTTQIFAHTLNVFALSCCSAFCVLQSRIHAIWTRTLSSTLEDRAGTGRIRYAICDCFEPFPFPQGDPRCAITELEGPGEHLYATRARFMTEHQQGLTKLYNALNDPVVDNPQISELRHLHENLDHLVLQTYGWSDVQVPPYCVQNDVERAAVKAFEDEVIDRLFALNAERAAQERAAGDAKSKSVTTDKQDESVTGAAKGVKKGGGKKAGKAVPEGQGSLF
jgi:hypothetical protein